MVKALLNIKDVTLILENKPILDTISFSVKSGEFITIIGPNGAGKSTLLKVIVGLIKPSSGQVCVEQGRRIGYMPQRLQLNEMMPLDVHTFLKTIPYPKKIWDHILKQTKIHHLLAASMHALSGGEFQRVLLARALLTQPNLLILDEPDQSLDVHGREEFYQLLDYVRLQMNTAIIMVSHDLHFVHHASDFVICLNHHICCMGQPQTVKHSSEYQKLFGKPLSEQLVPYVHSHDHSHDSVDKGASSVTSPISVYPQSPQDAGDQ